MPPGYPLSINVSYDKEHQWFRGKNQNLVSKIQAIYEGEEKPGR